MGSTPPRAVMFSMKNELSWFVHQSFDSRTYVHVYYTCTCACTCTCLNVYLQMARECTDYSTVRVLTMAHSSSAVPMRWPLVRIMSSTRPEIRYSPFSSRDAPSPVKYTPTCAAKEPPELILILTNVATKTTRVRTLYIPVCK